MVWTSSLKRTIATAQYINRPKIQIKILDEIDVGIFDGWTYDTIAQKRPEEFAARAANKLVIIDNWFIYIFSTIGTLMVNHI
jgi:broad specificity phosphatase PhoE